MKHHVFNYGAKGHNHERCNAITLERMCLNFSIGFPSEFHLRDFLETHINSSLPPLPKPAKRKKNLTCLNRQISSENLIKIDMNRFLGASNGALNVNVI